MNDLKKIPNLVRRRSVWRSGQDIDVEVIEVAKSEKDTSNISGLDVESSGVAYKSEDVSLEGKAHELVKATSDFQDENNNIFLDKNCNVVLDKNVILNTTNDLTKDTTNDLTKDTTNDLNKDTTNDLANDTTNDLTEDTNNDVTEDITNDVIILDTNDDVSLDTTNDATVDTTSNVALDTTNDVTLDTSCDVTVDTTNDVSQDTTNNFTLDTTYDFTRDVTCDFNLDTTCDIKMEDLTEVSDQSEGKRSWKQSMKTGEYGGRRYWQPTGNSIKKRKIDKNLHVRKYVQPKNAVLCLDEIRSGLEYEREENFEYEFCISVEVDGIKYKGYGSTEDMATQAAAEAALCSFWEPYESSSDSNSDSASESAKESTFATIASFAIFKLFNKWCTGQLGEIPPTELMYENFNASSIGPIEYSPAAQQVLPKDIFTMRPSKTLPKNAAQMNPVAVLHQMRPLITYDVTIHSRYNLDWYIARADIDDYTFIGEGPRIKVAKCKLAKDAIKEMFGVDSVYPMNNTY